MDCMVKRNMEHPAMFIIDKKSDMLGGSLVRGCKGGYFPGDASENG
jgi:hypothetical protein